MSRVILDTNVVSETARPRPSELVAAWFAAQTVEHLFLTATVLGELAFGTAKLLEGRRRTALEAWLQELLRDQFAERVLPYDAAAALIYGELVADARSRGREPKLARYGGGDAQRRRFRAARRHGDRSLGRGLTEWRRLTMRS